MQQRAIRQTRELVVQRHVANANFGLLAVRNIAGNAHRADHAPGAIAERHLGGKHPGLAAVRPGLLLLDTHQRFAGGENLLLVGKGLLGVLGAEEVAVGFADQVGGIRHVETFRHATADTNKAALAIFKKDIVRDVVKKGLEQVAVEFPSPVAAPGKPEQCTEHQAAGGNSHRTEFGEPERMRPVSGSEPARQQMDGKSDAQEGSRTGDGDIPHQRRCDLALAFHRRPTTPPHSGIGEQ